MAVPRTGALGTAALGSLGLGAPAIWTALPVPPTVHPRSALSDAGKTSALSATAARSAISAATARGGVA